MSVKRCASCGCVIDENYRGFHSAADCKIFGYAALHAKAEKEEAKKDYEDVLADYRRLTKELDIALNGDCAAKAPSLCDIIAQIKSLGTLQEIIMQSAKQAREQAADRALAFIHGFHPHYYFDNELRAAILGEEGK